MSLKIVPFCQELIEAAAERVVARYREERKQQVWLPEALEDTGSVRERLAKLTASAPGVAALDGGRLAGFLLGNCTIFRERRSTWCPDWAHAADGRDAYRALYAELSRQWLAAGHFHHAVTFLAHEREAIDAWFSLSFGFTLVDGLRDLELPLRTGGRLELRRATPDDLDGLLPLALELSRHLAAPPTYIPLLRGEDRQEHRKFLELEAHAVWLAFKDGRAVAFVRMEPPDGGVRPVHDPSSIAITGAYTRPELRGSGVATALVETAFAWAREQGYEHCSVDYESMNISSSWFWERKGFQPVCLSLTRTIDPRLAWAGEHRSMSSPGY